MCILKKRLMAHGRYCCGRKVTISSDFCDGAINAWMDNGLALIKTVNVPPCKWIRLRMPHQDINPCIEGHLLEGSSIVLTQLQINPLIQNCAGDCMGYMRGRYQTEEWFFTRKNTGAINVFLKEDLVQGHLPSFLAQLVDRISVLIFHVATLILHKLLRNVYAIAMLSTMLLSDSIFGCGNMACHEQGCKLEHHIASDII